MHENKHNRVYIKEKGAQYGDECCHFEENKRVSGRQNPIYKPGERKRRKSVEMTIRGKLVPNCVPGWVIFHHKFVYSGPDAGKGNRSHSIANIGPKLGYTKEIFG